MSENESCNMDFLDSMDSLDEIIGRLSFLQDVFGTTTGLEVAPEEVAKTIKSLKTDLCFITSGLMNWKKNLPEPYTEKPLIDKIRNSAVQ